MKPVMFYVLYLITLPDIEADDHAMHRLVFSYKEDCIEMAHPLWFSKWNPNFDIVVLYLNAVVLTDPRVFELR